MGMVIAIAETDISEFDISLDLLQLNGIGRVPDFRLDLHDFHEAVEAGNPFLELLGHVRQFLDGLDEVADIEQEGDQVSQVQGGPW